MKTVDIALRKCDRETAAQFVELDKVVFPSDGKSAEVRLAEVLNNPRCPVERHFLAVIGDEVVGGFRIMPLEMNVAEQPPSWIPVGGVGRLGVYPHYRRQGVGKGVLRLVLQRSWDQGDALLLAYPVNFRTFRRYGFGIGARHVMYGVPPEGFPEYPGRECIRPATVEDAESIGYIYENQLRCSRGIIRRSLDVWRQYYLSPGADTLHTQWLYEDEKGPSGYLSCWSQPTSKFYAQVLEVNEWFVTSARALRAFLGFFRAQTTNLELVKLPAPVGYCLESALVEPVYPDDPDLGPWRQPVGKLCSTLMGRIIRLHEAIAARQFEQDGSVNLLVEDWSLPANSGYYSLHVRGGRGELVHAEEGDADIRLDISVLSSLYCGTVTATLAKVFGLIEATPEAADILDRMLGRSTFMIWDYF
ncbi:MAG: GNAT family N-acetyltransferase [Bradymonadales bacterium]|nr:GNAT family N-acetyltransferase [Bradymonadales bacterium]